MVVTTDQKKKCIKEMRQHCTAQRNEAQHNATAQHSTSQRSATQRNSTAQHSTTKRNTTQQHSTAQRSATQRNSTAQPNPSQRNATQRNKTPQSYLQDLVRKICKFFCKQSRYIDHYPCRTLASLQDQRK